MNENTIISDKQISYDKQINFEGNAYLDPKHMPVATYNDLLNLSRSEIFEGITVKVISDENVGNNTTEYMFKNEDWVLITPTSEIIS